jgi:hypothetical protein
MDFKKFLKPNLPKIIITLLLPAVIGLILTFSISGAFAVYGMLLTPGYTLYSDIAYYEWNLYILGWIPVYIAACILSPVIEKMI